MGKLKDKLIAAITGMGIASAVTVTPDLLTCHSCDNSSFSIHDHNFINKCTLHFGSEHHEHESKWRLVRIGKDFKIETATPPTAFVDDFYGHEPIPKAPRLNPLGHEDEVDIDEVTHDYEEDDPFLMSLNRTSRTTQSTVSCCDNSTQTECLPGAESDTLEVEQVTNPPENISRMLSNLIGTDVSGDNLQNLKDYPFILCCIRNILLRGPRSQAEENTRAHDPTVKATVVKFALKHTFSAAEELTHLIGGPRKTNIGNEMQPDVPVLPYYCKENIETHLEKVKGNYVQK